MVRTSGVKEWGGVKGMVCLFPAVLGKTAWLISVSGQGNGASISIFSWWFPANLGVELFLVGLEVGLSLSFLRGKNFQQGSPARLGFHFFRGLFCAV